VNQFPALHVIADIAAVESNGFTRAAAALMRQGGERLALHVRAHGLPGGFFYDAVEGVAAVAQETGAWLVINDRLDVALACGQRRVILGKRSLPVRSARALCGDNATIGYSAHSAEEAAHAVSESADFVILGTVYETATHPGRHGSGVDLVRDAAQQIGVPVVAIGGITPERVIDVMLAGATGVAVLRGVWQSSDPMAAAQEYLDALRRVPQEK
jgi:thiamine-phosphate diphosphorylase